MKNSNLVALNNVGQSIWYDNVSRAVLRSGELAGLIANGVSGLTSNPTIFKKAIADSSDYDSDISDLAKKGLDADQICEDLMVGDIAEAADLLLPIFKATGGQDGYASIEVSPLLARDTAGTVEAAKRLWSKLNRPNIMVKIPGVKEGVPAIRAVLEAGININVTLLFSNEAYRSVAAEYIAALSTRASKGESIDNIASVASFFVSRVDSLVEKKLDQMGIKERSEVEGQVGIANSIAAYRSYQELFGSSDWKQLAAKKAMVQRPLWASTGTKNPKFSPVLYVEQLAGPDTVNTVPPATLNAILGGVVVKDNISDRGSWADDIIAKVSSLGVDLKSTLVELEKEGVSLFEQSYHELISAIQTKMKKLS